MWAKSLIFRWFSSPLSSGGRRNFNFFHGEEPHWNPTPSWWNFGGKKNVEQPLFYTCWGGCSISPFSFICECKKVRNAMFHLVFCDGFPPWWWFSRSESSQSTHSFEGWDFTHAPCNVPRKVDVDIDIPHIFLVFRQYMFNHLHIETVFFWLLSPILLAKKPPTEK